MVTRKSRQRGPDPVPRNHCIRIAGPQADKAVGVRALPRCRLLGSWVSYFSDGSIRISGSTSE